MLSACLRNHLVSQLKYLHPHEWRVCLRTFFAVLNEYSGCVNFAMFRQFLPLEDGLIFELVILDQY